jgi:hypothetical protein
MEMIKKNLVSILCGVVVIVAIVVWVWPVGAMMGDLQAKIEKSRQDYDAIETLRTAPRKLPSLVLEGGEQQATLDRFPNDNVIKEGERKTKALTDQSNEMLKTVSERNVHVPLVPGSLPSATGRPANDFVLAYLRRVGTGPDGWEDKSSLPFQLNATLPPNIDELNEAADKVWKEKYNDRIFIIGGVPNNLDAISNEFIEKESDLAERERKKRANEFRIYLDETSLPASPLIKSGKPPRPEEVWFAQTALWIQEDVVAAINAANAGSKSIPQSPVKHLVSMQVPFDASQYIRPPAAAAAPMGAMGPVAAAPEVTADSTAAPVIYAISPTGRASNSLYDVVHFTLVLRVDYQKIPQVLTELERNRLFTVLSTAVTAVDAAQERKVGYVYGDAPIAEITLQCEALFLRSWTVDKEHEYKNALMPVIVQETVGARVGPGLFGATGGGGGGAAPGGFGLPGFDLMTPPVMPGPRAP